MVDSRGVGQLGQFGVDRGKDSRHLRGRPPQILSGKDPQRDGGDRKLRAPFEDVIELPRAAAVRLDGIPDAPLAGIAAVAVEDDAHMTGHRVPADLAKETTRVEVVEDASHSIDTLGKTLPPREGAVKTRARSRC